MVAELWPLELLLLNSKIAGNLMTAAPCRLQRFFDSDLQPMQPNETDRLEMDEREDHGARENRRMADRLRDMLAEQIDALKDEPASGGYEEGRVKALLALGRAFQAMEELTRRLDLAADECGADAEDIVEFRERLAKQIDALGQSRAESPPAGETEP